MPEVLLRRTADLSPGQRSAVRALCDRAFGGRFDDDDWEHALGGWHAVALDGAQVVAHAAAVARHLEVAGRTVHVGYVEAVATAPARQREGLGARVMAEISTVIAREHELGALSTSAHEFYRRLGWERWLGPTYVRRGRVLERTEDEDDGVMVLRLGPTATLDLRAAISCEERPGDDW